MNFSIPRLPSLVPFNYMPFRRRSPSSRHNSLFFIRFWFWFWFPISLTRFLFSLFQFLCFSMENHNAKLVPSGGLKPNPGEQEENPTLNRCGEEEEVNTESAEPPSPNAPQSSRTPFTNLSQVDADLALARTLQEQERAYMMLRMNNEGSDYGSWEPGSYVHDDEDDFHDDTDGNDDDEHYDGTDADNDEEDAFDVHAHEDAGDDHNPSVVYDPAVFSSDEAYARALQDAEDRDMAARLMAFTGIGDREAEDTEDQGGNSQDAWEEVDPDELSYEELLALGEVVGTESRGLPADTIASLPSVSYKMGNGQNGSNESCVICRLDYEDGENLTVLSCTHSYHSECINNWLIINKVCPVCSAEVSTSGNS